MTIYRDDFPIFKKNANLVYLDSAATTQKPHVVLDAVIDYYQNYNANIHRGIYPIAEKATAKVEEVRERVRKFINARYKEEIIFTKSTTESINLVASTWGKKYIKKGDIIQVPISEHHANFVPWQQLCLEKGAKFEVLNLDEYFQFAIPSTEKAKLLTVSHISNVLGSITPIKEIIKIEKAKNKELKVLVDAAQSIAHRPLDVQRMDCDFLAFSGHKMFAETGIGVLYVKRELLENMPPYLLGGDMIREVSISKTTFAELPNKFEAGTLNISGIISLGAALSYIENIGFENIQKHEERLTRYILERLRELEGISVLGGEKNAQSGIVSFTMEGIHPHDIAQVLGDNNICIRAGHHCAMPLHTALGHPATARVSLSIYNTEDDINKFIEGLKRVRKIF